MSRSNKYKSKAPKTPRIFYCAECGINQVKYQGDWCSDCTLKLDAIIEQRNLLSKRI